MKNPLIINIRCSCIEEYINIQRLHKEYTRQLRTGEIMSVFVGAELAVPGEFAVVDKLMEKGGQCRKSPVTAFPMAFNNTLSQEEQMAIKEEINRGAVLVNGPMPEEEIALPQAVDGGVDAMGNPPLPEGKRPYEEEVHGQPVPQPALQEVAKPDPDFVFEDEAAPKESFNEPPFRHVPETLTAVGTEPFSTFGPQEFNQAAPSVAEESDDGWNGEDHNYTC